MRSGRTEEKQSQFLERFNAATDRWQDGRVVDIDNAGRRKRRAVRRVRHKQLHGVIRVDRAKRVLAQRDRQPRALRRPRFVRIARGRPPPPNVARALAVRDEHAESRHGVEHRECIALRLVEREVLFLRARVDREARGGRGRVLVLVLVHGEVQRRPDEDLQLRKVLLYDAQYALVLPSGLQQGIRAHERVCRSHREMSICLHNLCFRR